MKKTLLAIEQVEKFAEEQLQISNQKDSKRKTGKKSIKKTLLDQAEKSSEEQQSQRNNQNDSAEKRKAASDTSTTDTDKDATGLPDRRDSEQRTPAKKIKL